ncbi:hypothetical protein [Streptomyces sp. NPDC047028]|uniref:hypothetical protein n=1 Tax=Streptomyces sp. NPDC047028 TaxID=3155793 RepID=UPI0033D9FCD1
MIIVALLLLPGLSLLLFGLDRVEDVWFTTPDHQARGPRHALRHRGRVPGR